MPILKIIEERLPSQCWKCKSRLVLRGRGLYCEECHRYRCFLFAPVLHWKSRGGRQFSYVDVRESGRLKRPVMLKRFGSP